MGTAPEHGHGRAEPGAHALMSERRHLLNLTYRLLGTLAEAEDAVQETYARWYAMSRSHQEAIESPGAWLSKVASRICLDMLGSARARRENYVGQWLPEPLPDPSEGANGRPGAADPADRVTLDESVGMAFLVVLQAMTPAERVAFILHDVFAYPFAEVADVVGRTPAACRELASSARRRVRVTQPVTAPVAHRAGVVRDFKRAWEAGDIRALISLLDSGAALTGDGGASTRPIEGNEKVARFLIDIVRWRPANARLVERSVNGEPGLVAEQDGVPLAVYAFEVAGDQITRIWAIINPDKLKAWGAT
jgi:RNA polymerase sigma factor (sigma-70 family)